MRVKFEKGKQREFLKEVLNRIGAPSIAELARRFDINSSSLKNYFNENRLLPGILFETLCEISGLAPKIELFEENWGKVKGGKKPYK